MKPVPLSESEMPMIRALYDTDTFAPPTDDVRRMVATIDARADLLPALKAMVGLCDCIYGEASDARSMALAAIKRAEGR